MKKIGMFCLSAFVFFSCTKITQEKENENSQISFSKSSELLGQPNIILILADDIGYEVPQYTGGKSYSTPRLNALATTGRQFSKVFTLALCSPSRQSLMTGKYNNQNYKIWGTMAPGQKTIGNLLQDAGYMTAAFGKWQLDGDDAGIKNFGFGYYNVFEPKNTNYPLNNVDNETALNRYRYKNPILYANARFDTFSHKEYADNLFIDSASKFMNTAIQQGKPFFIYHSLSLVHSPYSPTPDDSAYKNYSNQNLSNTKWFPSMMKYMDKEIGKIVDSVTAKGIAGNTVIIFLGDNGTPNQISSIWNDPAIIGDIDQTIVGGKNATTVWGTHVPCIVAGAIGYIPVIPGIDSSLIDLTDFLPTLADLAGVARPKTYGILNGISFYKNIIGLPRDSVRSASYTYYYPQSSPNSIKRNYAFTGRYKKYDKTNKRAFYDMYIDPYELSPLDTTRLTSEQLVIKNNLNKIMGEQSQYTQP